MMDLILEVQKHTDSDPQHWHLACNSSAAWIRIDFNADPDPAFLVNVDPDPGF
jgi:hypothetical protein